MPAVLPGSLGRPEHDRHQRDVRGARVGLGSPPGRKGRVPAGAGWWILQGLSIHSRQDNGGSASDLLAGAIHADGRLLACGPPWELLLPLPGDAGPRPHVVLGDVLRNCFGFHEGAGGGLCHAAPDPAVCLQRGAFAHPRHPGVPAVDQVALPLVLRLGYAERHRVSVSLRAARRVPFERYLPRSSDPPHCPGPHGRPPGVVPLAKPRHVQSPICWLAAPLSGNLVEEEQVRVVGCQLSGGCFMHRTHRICQGCIASVCTGY
mmetsp:Transcript_114536/g.304488  ORF Transcript_114536/g.304488 Transcript_114536/m.304488 type:complete len:262 (+) Transcript_114536:719-1504(+)